jgi:hypothetical protein
MSVYFLTDNSDPDRCSTRRERAVRDYVQAGQESLQRDLGTAQPAAKLRRLDA